MNLDTFTRAYIEAMLWSSTDDLGIPLDLEYNISHIDQESLVKAVADCRGFRNDAGTMLDEWTDEQAGHDFWLTRNGHGAGFWDRAKDLHTMMPYGEELTALAHKFGELRPYIGDDGKVYL